MNKIFTENGWLDYVYWETEDQKTLKKIPYRTSIKLPHAVPGIMETFPDVRQFPLPQLFVLQFPPVQEFVPQFVSEEQLPLSDPAVQPVPQLFPAAPLGHPFPNSV